MLDLSIKTLMAACKGNVKNLPSFMVHDNDAWVTQAIRLDTKNRIHLRRSTFLQVVTTELPVRAGIWHGLDVQEFHIDLQPHHLQGSHDMVAADGYKHNRVITLTDPQGRNPGDDDYGDAPPKPVRITKSDLDAARAETGGQLRGVGSTALGNNSE